MRWRCGSAFFAPIPDSEFYSLSPVISCSAGPKLSVMSLDLMSLALFKSGMALAFMDSAACRRRHGSAAARFEIRFTPVGVFADSSPFPRKRDAAVMAPQAAATLSG
jgi:hypothetical protein